MSNFELEKWASAVSWKAVFSLVKDLFNWIEGLCRSVIILVGSEAGLIFDLGRLQKKLLSTLSNFELEKWASAVSWKAVFSLVKDLFNWIEGLCRSVIILVGSEAGLVFDLGRLQKKLLSTLSNFELEKWASAVSWKSVFSLDKDLFNWIEGLCRSVIILVGSEAGLIFDLGRLQKKYSARCQISSSKRELVQFHEKRFSV